ncbi:cobalt-precorrin-5B (C(1))-methyltransferase CbiD [Fusobacterium nucleatum]|uniref:cobalt-precorrin-5B (C(1))-methyltransferase CbiD n=1 Tax=Fusobacterium nucleatum TaxID=851 RepID=UPI0030D5897E
MEEKKLKNGYTTGTCATAAVKVALEALIYGKKANEVDITTLNYTNLKIPVQKLRVRNNFASCAIQKYAGDDPDVTNGISICAKVKLVKELPKIDRGAYYANCVIIGGRGVGLVSKKGLQIAVGKSAINPGPQKMITSVVNEILDGSDEKVIITIYVPEGRAKALKTYNPKMGVIGGISVLGTTGIVKAMSEDALKKSMFAELKVMREDKNRDWVIFAFGNYGERHCQKIGLDTEQLIIISNFVGFMIEAAVKLEFKKIIMLGHIAKAIKVAGGIFNTHSRVADGRMETMASCAFLVDEKPEIIRKILASNTIEEACDYIENKEIYHLIANRVAFKMQEYARADIEVSAAIFSFKGETIGESDNYRRMVGECGAIK